MSKDTIQRVVGGLQVISGALGIFYGGAYGAGGGSGNLLGQGIANLQGKDTGKWWHRKGGFGQDVLSSFGVGQLSPNYDPNTPQNKYGAIGQVAGGLLGAASGAMSGGGGDSGGGGGGGGGYGQWIKLGLKGAMSQQGGQTSSGGRASYMAPAVQGFNYSGAYDTPLNPTEEQQYQAWKQIYAPNDSGYDYDLRGAFMAGLTPADNGHWADQFKKPNHPTFSDQSQYAAVRPELAGHWEGDVYVPPQQLKSAIVGNGLDFENGQSTIPPQYRETSQTLSDLLLNYFQTGGR